MLLLVAFTVVAGTLLLQGLTLPWLARRLDVPVARPGRGRAGPGRPCCSRRPRPASQGSTTMEYDDHHGVSELIRPRLDQRNFAAWERLGTAADEETPERALRPASGWR